MRPDVSHIGLAVDTGDGGSCRRPPLGGRTRLVIIIILPTSCAACNWTCSLQVVTNSHPELSGWRTVIVHVNDAVLHLSLGMRGDL